MWTFLTGIIRLSCHLAWILVKTWCRFDIEPIWVYIWCINRYIKVTRVFFNGLFMVDMACPRWRIIWGRCWADVGPVGPTSGHWRPCFLGYLGHCMTDHYGGITYCYNPPRLSLVNLVATYIISVRNMSVEKFTPIPMTTCQNIFSLPLFGTYLNYRSAKQTPRFTENNQMRSLFNMAKCLVILWITN